MKKRLERIKNTINKYMADIRPDRLTTCQSERKSVVSRRLSVMNDFFFNLCGGTSGTAATSGLLSQPRVIMMM
jgi:hypothetical protein